MIHWLTRFWYRTVLRRQLFRVAGRTYWVRTTDANAYGAALEAFTRDAVFAKSPANLRSASIAIFLAEWAQEHWT